MAQTDPSSKIAAFVMLIGVLAWGTDAQAGGRTCLSSVKQLKNQVALLETFRTVRGGYPADLDELALFLDSTERVDPWGGSLIYEIQGEGFLLGSAGPDRKKGTSDDLVYGPELAIFEQQCVSDFAGDENEDGEWRGVWLGLLLLSVGLGAATVVAIEMNDGRV